MVYGFVFAGVSGLTTEYNGEWRQAWRNTDIRGFLNWNHILNVKIAWHLEQVCRTDEEDGEACDEEVLNNVGILVLLVGYPVIQKHDTWTCQL